MGLTISGNCFSPLSTLRVTISMSLDGFYGYAQQNVANPIWLGGERLHEMSGSFHSHPGHALLECGGSEVSERTANALHLAVSTRTFCRLSLFSRKAIFQIISTCRRWNDRSGNGIAAKRRRLHWKH